MTSVLTARGWGLVAFAVVATGAGRTFGIGELYALAVAAAVAIVYALLWAVTRRWRLEVVRELRPSRAEAGQGALVVLTLHNPTTLASPTLTLRDPFDGGTRSADILVAPVPARRRVAGSYRLPPAGRGVFTVGPLRLEAVDPLGLARRSRTNPAVSTFVVHPRVEPLAPPRVAAGKGTNQGAALPVPGRDNDEFASLREYRPGDDIRRMHWPSTARTDTLMVREDQVERRGRFTVVLDTRRELWSAASFERAASAAASITAAALDGGLDARLRTTGGDDSGTGSGPAHRTRALDILALVSPHTTGSTPADPTGGIRGAAQAMHRGGTVVVVTSDRARTEEVRNVAGPGYTEVITVVIERSSGPAAGPPVASARAGTVRTVRVGPGAGLAQSWDRLG